MALFYPTIERILTMKVPPTEGELNLLRFLESSLDDSFDVYFNPYMNGDRPDVVMPLVAKQEIIEEDLMYSARMTVAKLLGTNQFEIISVHKCI